MFGAYYRPHKAMFFWGPKPDDKPEDKKALGWDIKGFQACPVKFIPIDYPDVHVAFHARAGSGPARKQPWARAGGGAMWRQPRTDQLKHRVKKLADTTKEDHEEPKPRE